MIYLIILLYTIILIIRYDLKRCEKNDYMHSWALFILISATSGFGYRLGYDGIGYSNIFDNLFPDISKYQFFGPDMFTSGNEPIWLFLNVVIKQFTGEFLYVKLIVSLFVNGTIFWFLKKHSPAFYLSIFFYLIYGFFNFNFEILRESIAVAFFLIALDKMCENKRDYLHYYLWCIPVILCHSFGIIVLFFPVFFNLKINTHYFIILSILFLLSPLLGNALSDFSIGFQLMEGQLVRIQEYMEHEKYGIITNNSIFFLLKISLFAIFPYIIMILYSRSEKKICMSCALSYIIVLMLTQSSFFIAYRFKNYLLIPTTVILADAIYSAIVLKKIDGLPTFMKTIDIVKVIFIYMIVLSIYSNITSSLFPFYYPYVSVFEKDTYNNMERDTYYLNYGK